MSKDKTRLFERQYPRQRLGIRAWQHGAGHAVDLHITARILRTCRVRRDAYRNAGVVVMATNAAALSSPNPPVPINKHGERALI